MAKKAREGVQLALGNTAEASPVTLQGQVQRERLAGPKEDFLGTGLIEAAEQ